MGGRKHGNNNSSSKYDMVRSSGDAKDEAAPIRMRDLFIILLPFFWPEGLKPKIYSSLTWLCVGLSKTAGLLSPIYMSSSINYLMELNFKNAINQIIIFCVLKYLSTFLKELQQLIFYEVKKQAFIQLSVQTFAHIHTLSLNWHLSKMTGSVIRSIDRGTEAANQLVSLVFMFLGPALLECLAVFIIFLVHFQVWTLAVVILVSVFIYVSVSYIKLFLSSCCNR